MKIKLKLIAGGTIILDTTDRMDLDKLHVALTEAFLVYWKKNRRKHILSPNLFW